MTEPCVVVAELGPNPAPLAELLWALVRQRRRQVREAFILTSARGRAYLEQEFFAPGGAHEQLVAVLGASVPARDKLHVRVVCDAGGDALSDERTPEDAALWNEARWQNARAAMTAAREIPVVFALAGGRRRTSSAMTTVVFQMLGRGRDVLVDVRVGDRRVEGAWAGFYFPEQRDQRLGSASDALVARNVVVHLVDVAVPRLRRLLGGREFQRWDEALGAGVRAVEALPTVSIVVDLAAFTVTVNGTPVRFSEAEFIWFAAIAKARATQDDGWLRSEDANALREVIIEMKQSRETDWTPRAKSWQRVLAGTPDDGDDAILSKHRSTAAARFLLSLKKMKLPDAVVREAQLQQEVRSEQNGTLWTKFTVWRLPIDPENITLRPEVLNAAHGR